MFGAPRCSQPDSALAPVQPHRDGILQANNYRTVVTTFGPAGSPLLMPLPHRPTSMVVAVAPRLGPAREMQQPEQRQQQPQRLQRNPDGTLGKTAQAFGVVACTAHVAQPYYHSISPKSPVEVLPSGSTMSPAPATADNLGALQLFMNTSMVKHVQDRFNRFLGLLEQKGVLDVVRVSTDSPGVLRVSVPFCGGFFEAPILMTFLRRFAQTRPEISKVDVYCCDLSANAAFVSLSVLEPNSLVSVRYEARDLSRSALPPADFVLGLQPEVNNEDTSDAWKTIIDNCARAAPLAIFATLQPVEAQTVRLHCDSVAETEFFEGLTRDNSLNAYDGLRYAHVVVAKRRMGR